jgi:deoxyribodipyrimidine photo-lyase
MRTLVWFRGKDLRVHDHAPLLDAIAGGEVIPLFVLDPWFFAPERAREIPHRMQFLLGSLHELSETIARLGSRLVVLEGRSVEVIPRVADAWRVDRVVAHRWVEPFGRERDRRIADALRVPLKLYEGETLLPPGTLRTSSGDPFSVFTPFKRAFLITAQIARPLDAPAHVPPLPAGVTTTSVAIPSLESLGITPNPRVIAGGENAARARLATFVANRLAGYNRSRDQLADDHGTSRLSQDLKFGTLSARAVWHAAASHAGSGPDGFRRELIWREFSHHVLWTRPEVLERPFRAEFEGFPWRDDDDGWRAWIEGRTGYPVVDAAARELLETGYVHNRARMIAASFLTRHLMIDYRRGEAHYMRWLTDGDWAQNNFNWQWSAGCGCDAQPYFRVFNPTLQAEKFDADGSYVRRWMLEAKRVAPIVDHAKARARFLETAKQHIRRK